ncbi:hypothetical protein M8C21_012512, partial [Ambrosia artemisiifolia]
MHYLLNVLSITDFESGLLLSFLLSFSFLNPSLALNRSTPPLATSSSHPPPTQPTSDLQSSVKPRFNKKKFRSSYDYPTFGFRFSELQPSNLQYQFSRKGDGFNSYSDGVRFRRRINRGRERFDDREKGFVNAPFDVVDKATYTLSTMERPIAARITSFFGIYMLHMK